LAFFEENISELGLAWTNRKRRTPKEQDADFGLVRDKPLISSGVKPHECAFIKQGLRCRVDGDSGKHRLICDRHYDRTTSGLEALIHFVF